MSKEATEIKTISDSELEELLNITGSEEVIVPVQNVNPLNIEKENSLLDIPEKIPTKKIEGEPVKISEKEIENTLKIEDSEIPDPPAKAVSSDYLEDFIKDGTFLLFDDDKKWEEYSEKDKKELVKANMERIRQEEAEKIPAEFFDSLPPELQYAANYVANGGKNLKNLFKSLSGLEDTKQLDISTVEGQEETVRKFMLISNLGTPEEVEQEIADLKDMPGALEKKANQYKPKLDSKAKEQVEKQLKDQEEFRKKQELLATKYRESVLETIQTGEIGGIKITPSTQNMLFSGLTEVNYQSASGRPTNLFGHLLEQHQYVKPNTALIAEVLWLMKDPESYKNAVKKSGKEEGITEVVRQLKTTASEKPGTTSTVQTTKQNTMPKPKANPFKVRTG